jgi:hypothetical protein
MVYRCETAVAAERLVGTDGMLTGADAPALGDWTLAGATGYLFSDLSPVAQAFVQSRNLLEGNAAQCCRCALAPSTGCCAPKVVGRLTCARLSVCAARMLYATGCQIAAQEIATTMRSKSNAF